MKYCFTAMAFLLTMKAFASTFNQTPKPASKRCESFLKKRNLVEVAREYAPQITRMLKKNVITENDLALATVVTARPKAGGGLFGVLIKENSFFAQDEPYTYYTLKTGLFGRPIWGYLRYEKPGDYLLSNGQVAHVFTGVHRGVFGKSVTRNLSVE